MLRFARKLPKSTTRGTSSRFRSNAMVQDTHVPTLSARGIELRVLSHHRHQQKIFFSRFCRHDGVLTASMGLVSGGLLVTSGLHNQEKKSEELVTNLYGNANDLFYYQNGRQFDEPWYEDTNKKAIAAIIAANTIIFGLWRVSFQNARLHQFMWKHFASSYDAVVHGKRFHTLLTSSFSHLTFPHFGINMFMLWEFGPDLLAPRFVKDQYNNFRHGPELLTIQSFMALYLTSAMTSSALSALVSKLRGNTKMFSIGASGAVSAVFTLSCLLFPAKRLLLYGIFDLTSAQMLELYTAMNLLGAAFQRHLRIDCVGHLGGQVTGLAFYQAN